MSPFQIDTGANVPQRKPSELPALTPSPASLALVGSNFLGSSWVKSRCRSIGSLGRLRLCRIPFLRGEDGVGDHAMGPLAGWGFAVEALISQSDERADEAGALSKPLRDQALHRRRCDPRFIARFEYLSGVNLLVVDIIRNEGPGVLPLR